MKKQWLIISVMMLSGCATSQPLDQQTFPSSFERARRQRPYGIQRPAVETILDADGHPIRIDDSQPQED